MRNAAKLKADCPAAGLSPEFEMAQIRISGASLRHVESLPGHVWGWVLPLTGPAASAELALRSIKKMGRQFAPLSVACVLRTFQKLYAKPTETMGKNRAGSTSFASFCCCATTLA